MIRSVCIQADMSLSSLSKLFLVLFVFSSAYFLLKIYMETRMEDFNRMSNQEKANRTIKKIAKLQGLEVVDIPQSGVIGYGSLEFRHNSTNREFRVSILISADPLWDSIDDEATRAQFKFVKALDDPKIGGMFDTANSTWHFEQSTGRLMLGRDFLVDSDPKVVSEYIDRLLEVSTFWISDWILAVSDIVFHGKASPINRITAENNPYVKK